MMIGLNEILFEQELQPKETIFKYSNGSDRENWIEKAYMIKSLKR